MSGGRIFLRGRLRARRKTKSQRRDDCGGSAGSKGWIQFHAKALAETYASAAKANLLACYLMAEVKTTTYKASRTAR